MSDIIGEIKSYIENGLVDYALVIGTSMLDTVFNSREDMDVAINSLFMALDLGDSENGLKFMEGIEDYAYHLSGASWPLIISDKQH